MRTGSKRREIEFSERVLVAREIRNARAVLPTHLPNSPEKPRTKGGLCI